MSHGAGPRPTALTRIFDHVAELDTTTAGELRHALAAARRDGQPFEQAWAGALAEVSPHPWWLMAFGATRGEWQMAYENRPGGIGRTLAHAIDRAELAA